MDTSCEMTRTRLFFDINGKEYKKQKSECITQWVALSLLYMKLPYPILNRYIYLKTWRYTIIILPFTTIIILPGNYSNQYFFSFFKMLICKILVNICNNNTVVRTEFFVDIKIYSALSLYFPILQVFSTIDSTCMIKRVAKNYILRFECIAIDFHVYRWLAAICSATAK